mgnify:CR=1 FL=1
MADVHPLGDVRRRVIDDDGLPGAQFVVAVARTEPFDLVDHLGGEPLRVQDEVEVRAGGGHGANWCTGSGPQSGRQIAGELGWRDTECPSDAKGRECEVGRHVGGRGHQLDRRGRNKTGGGDRGPNLRFDTVQGVVHGIPR